jgi:hypothetical protein
MTRPTVPRPEIQALYPTLGSVQEVLDLADSKLPITSSNELKALLMTYHNTLLSQLK